MTTLIEELARIFRKNGWTWTLQDGEEIVPDEEDIQLAIDKACELLYNREPGTQLEVGRLIVQKKYFGHDIYMFIGEYE